MLDQAAAEAYACARWYRDTPEWQRMNRIGRAARELLQTIREAAGDYWAEIRLDVRVRGFARTLAARVSLAVSGAAHLLAGRLERAGRRDTRPWRAAWRLYQATTTFADRVMNYAPPGSRTRMDDARHIIDDLSRSPRRPGARRRPRQLTHPARKPARRAPPRWAGNRSRCWYRGRTRGRPPRPRPARPRRPGRARRGPGPPMTPRRRPGESRGLSWPCRFSPGRCQIPARRAGQCAG